MNRNGLSCYQERRDGPASNQNLISNMNENELEMNEPPKKRSALARAWDLIWPLAVLLFACFCLVCTFRQVRNTLRFRAWAREQEAEYYRLSEKIGLKYLNGDEVRLIDWETKDPVSPKWRWVSDIPERDSIAVFCRRVGKGRHEKELRGFFNIHTGEVVQEASYAHAWVFSEGLGAVVGEDGRVGFLRPDGTWAIPPAFPYKTGVDYVFRGGVCWIPDEDRKVGAIDPSGRWLVAPQYDWARPLSDSLYTVSLDGKVGLMDNTMQYIFPPEYDEVRLHPDGKRAAYLTKDAVKQLVTFDGKVLEPFVIDSMVSLRYEDDEEEYGRLSGYFSFRVGDGIGVLDGRTGRIILPAVFEDVEMPSANLFECDIDSDYEKRVLYDLDGRPLSGRQAAETRSSDLIGDGI